MKIKRGGRSFTNGRLYLRGIGQKKEKTQQLLEIRKTNEKSFDFAKSSKC